MRKPVARRKRTGQKPQKSPVARAIGKERSDADESDRFQGVAETKNEEYIVFVIRRRRIRPWNPVRTTV